MDVKEFKEKLKEYHKEDIIITDHAGIQAMVRQIDEDEVINNLLNPDKLVFVKEQESRDSDLRKYDCYFAYSKLFAHKYIITINRKIIIVTIIAINRDWQKILEGK